MKGKRLGRGLAEVSHVFLSGESARIITEDPHQPSPEVPVFKEEPAPAIPAIGITGIPQQDIGVFALCNISIELARQGYRVLVIDDDPGSMNVMRLMGLMDTQSHAETIFHNAPMGIRIAYRTSFLNDLLSRDKFEDRGESFYWPEKYRRFDFILIHVPCGRLGEIGSILRCLSRLVVIAPTEPQGMLEAYRAIKELHQRARQVEAGLTVYSDKGKEAAQESFHRMAGNVKRFLKKELVSYSYIEKDEEIDESLKEAIPLALKCPSSDSRRQIYNISGLFIEDHDSRRPVKAGTV